MIDEYVINMDEALGSGLTPDEGLLQWQNYRLRQETNQLLRQKNQMARDKHRLRREKDQLAEQNNRLNWKVKELTVQNLKLVQKLNECRDRTTETLTIPSAS